jgi:class 3 adenylate cyclase
MALKDELIKNVDEIIAARWQERDGRVVPESKDVAFLGSAVKLEATFLYADLADSTSLARQVRQIAAEVFQCFLSTASRIIKAEGGEIRSFDGDRVMAVFMGNHKNTVAARCALKINWAFSKIVKPKILDAYGPKLSNYTLSYGSGLDVGEVWAIRGGVRNDSDLVWVGRAPNLGAKLSGIRDGYATHITKAVYDALNDSSKLGGDPRRSMWEQTRWSDQDNMIIFRSDWIWEP